MMRPQDILILLAVVQQDTKAWLGKDIAYLLGISGGEVSESLRRSRKAGLFNDVSKKVNKPALFEFMVHGMRYVFPQHAGPVARGIPTSVSASPLAQRTESSEKYVWPHPKGTLRGHSIEPLYPTVADASLRSPELYALFSLTDALRTGKARERELAKQELEKCLLLGAGTT
jgi:hypothetical protein